MTGTDLHQRMLHLLDRAKTMSAGGRQAVRHEPAAISATSTTPTSTRQIMTGLTPMESPVDYGPPVDREKPALQPAHAASQAPGIHVPELGPREPAASYPDSGERVDDDADGQGQQRQKVLRRGKITWQSGNFEIECQVHDLSTTGAKLRLAGDVTTPSCFSITIYPEKVTKMAQVCWRDELTLGVQFIDD